MDIPSIRLHPYMYDCLYPERNEFNELILVEEYKDAMNKLTPYERVIINNIKCEIKYDDMSYLIKLRDEERQEKLIKIMEAWTSSLVRKYSSLRKGNQHGCHLIRVCQF